MRNGGNKDRHWYSRADRTSFIGIYEAILNETENENKRKLNIDKHFKTRRILWKKQKYISQRR